MKKIGIIAFLAIFLFNTAGYYVVFLAQQVQIKSEIRSQINSGFYDEELTSVITINKADLSAVEFFDEGEEMRYKGSMYDIVKKKESAKEITYYCINDSHEESLMARLDSHIKTHVSDNKPLKHNSPKKMTDNIVKIYFTAVADFHFYQTIVPVDYLSAANACLPAEKQNSTPPPPEFC